MFKLFRNSKNVKIKIVKGKDGKKGLKINRKLVLPVEYDYIGVSYHHVYFEQYGVGRWKRIEDFLEGTGRQ